MSIPTPEPVHVLLIGGSRSHPSRTRGLLEAAVAAVRQRGATAAVWDVGRVGARDANGARRARQPSELRALAARAHALVVVTPTYHHSYSGLIKHALDHLDRSALAGKPAGLMTTCGTSPTPQAVDQLRIVVRALGATAIPSQVVATECGFRRLSDGYRVADAPLLEGVRTLITELMWFAQRLRRPANGAVHVRRPAAALAAAAQDATAPRTSADAVRLGNGDFPDQIMRAVRYIVQNFTKGQLSLDSVAREACMSRYHFSRTFKRETGTRFIDFLTTVRLAEACTLLTQTDQSITSIAFGVGYRDLSHFERTFKKEFGFSPSQYRNRLRAGLEAPPQLPWQQELVAAAG